MGLTPRGLLRVQGALTTKCRRCRSKTPGARPCPVAAALPTTDDASVHGRVGYEIQVHTAALPLAFARREGPACRHKPGPWSTGLLLDWLWIWMLAERFGDLSDERGA